jgi:glucose-1-phosphate cytidylyltransferase
MKLVILAGGYGTRISEETSNKPKPMVNIGGKPILWHIMKYYSKFGIDEFIICLGYKGEEIKRYFLNYRSLNSDLNIDLGSQSVNVLTKKTKENWKINLIDTGLNTMTGGRLKFIKKFLKKDEDFYFTYGDGLANVNINKLSNFHKKHKKLCTVTAIRQPTKYGKLQIQRDLVTSFNEKNRNKIKNESWINGGFFVVNSKAISFVESNKSSWEFDVLSKLVKLKSLKAYRHYGFWQCMDTLKDKLYLEEIWKKNKAPWKNW